MLTRRVFVAPVALAAPSPSTVIAFAGSPPAAPNGRSAASCTTTPKQAALLARLRERPGRAGADAAGQPAPADTYPERAVRS